MADLSIKATLSGADEATRGLGRLSDQVKQVATSQDEWAQIQANLNRLGAEHQAVLTRNAEATQKLKDHTAEVVKVFYEQQQATAHAAEGFEKVGAAGMHAGFGSAYARRELIIIGREVAEGQFSRIPGSMLTLAAHTGLFATGMLALSAAVIGVAGGFGALIYGFVAGRKEMEAMNNALSMTNNYAGLTRGGMIAMAESISQAGTLTIGTSKDIVTQIVASGRYGSENVALLARATENYAVVTGESVDKVTPKLIKMFEDPARASETLNQQYHYLSVAELERIQTLQNTGRHQEAVTAALIAFNNVLPDHVTKLGTLETAWKNITQNISGYKNALLSLGRDTTIEEKLKKKQEEIATLQVHGASKEMIESRKQEAMVLMDEYVAQQKLNAVTTDSTRLQEKQVGAQKEIDKAATVRIRRLNEEIETIKESGVASVDKDRRIKELTQEREALEQGLDSVERARAAKAEQAQKKEQTDWEKWAKRQIELEDLDVKHGESSLENEIELIDQLMAATKEGTDFYIYLQKEKEKALKEFSDKELASYLLRNRVEREAEAEGVRQYKEDKAEKTKAVTQQIDDELAAIRNTVFETNDLRITALQALLEKYKELADIAPAAYDRIRKASRDTKTEAEKDTVRISQIMGKAGFDIVSVWGGAFHSIQQGFYGILSGTQTVGQGVKSIWKGIVDSIIQEFARMAARWALAQISMALFGKNFGLSGATFGGGTRALGSEGGGSLPGEGSSVGGINISSLFGSGATSGIENMIKDFALTGLGQTLGSQMITDIGTSFASIAGDFSGGLPFVGAAISALQGNWGSAIGTVLGTMVGGPIGGMIGGFLGGMFQEGGDQVVTRPTLFMAGEMGPEHLSVRPLAGGSHSAGGRSVTNVFVGPNMMDAFTLRRFVREQERLIRAEAGRHG